MQENGVDVYIRHRNELLKAIYDNTSPEQEVGDFLLSTLNLYNYGIKYDLLDADKICLSYSEYILQKDEGTGEGKIPFVDFRPAMTSTYGTDHQWVGRMKNSWTPDDDKKHGHPFFKPKRENKNHKYSNEKELHHSHMRNNLIPMSMKHALWPEALPHRVRVNHRREIDEDGHPTGRRVEETEMELAKTYRHRHPYDESLPMRRIRADTGMPEWENTLRNFYFPNSDKPAFAERLMNMEDKHEQHWLKRTQHSLHGTYQGIDSGYGKKRFPFFGGGDKGHESGTKHRHTLRLRDFERWKNPVENTEWDIPGHREHVAKLEEEGKDLEIEHFNDRMTKLNSHDVMEKTHRPSEGLSSEEIYEKDPKENQHLSPSARKFQQWAHLEDYKKVHGHGMGWPTLNMGLHFLSPDERTSVMNHIDKHGTDHPDHQSVKLEDGQRLHMSRIKKNMAMMQGPEADWFTRAAKDFGPNKHKHIEIPSDTLVQGDDGMASKALKETYLKDGLVHSGEPYGTVEKTVRDEKTGKTKTTTVREKLYDDTAHALLQRNISDSYEGDKLLHYTDEGDTNLFPFSERDVKKIQGKLDEGKNLKEALKGHIGPESDIPLSGEALHRLVGYDKEDRTASYPAGKYPIFRGQQEPFLNESIMKAVLDNFDRLTGVGQAGPDIRNSHGAARQGTGGPDPEDPKLRPEEKEHYYQDGKKLRGWSWPFARPYTHGGGLGRQPTTQVELLHDFLSNDIQEEYWDEENEMYYSPFGSGTSSILGDKIHAHGGRITHNSGTVGLFGSMHPHVQPKGQTVHNTALGIISKTDTNSHSQHKIGTKRGKGRNIKTNSSDYDSTRSPELASLIEYKNPSEKDYTMDVKGLRRGLDQSGFHENNNYTKTSAKRYVNANMWKKLSDTEKERFLLQGEISMRNMAGFSHMFATANSRIRPPNDPAERMHNNYDDMVNDRGILSSKTTPHADFMQHIPTSKKSSVLDKLPEGFFDRVQALEDELYASPHDEWERKEIQSMLLPLKEQYDAMYQRQMRGTGQSSQRQKGYGWRERNDASMVGDKRAIAERMRDYTIPLIEKEHPEAFHPDNPLALANVMRAFRDTQRDIYINGGGDARTEGFHVREGKAKTASDRHFTLATLIKNMPENTIDRDKTSVKEALRILGLPDDDAHKEHVKGFMNSLREPVKAFSLSQLASLGYPWDNNGKPLFDSVTGVRSMHDHMDSLLDIHHQSVPKTTDYEPEVLPSGKISMRHKTEFNNARRKHYAAFKAGNPAYNALGALQHIATARRPVMKNYALNLYTSPQPKTKKGTDHQQSKDGRTLLHPSAFKSGVLRENNDRKDIASHILSFHPSEEPDGGLKANTPPIDKPSIGFYSAPIGSLDEQKNLVLHDHFGSDAMNWGYRMQPEIGIEHGAPGTDGKPTVGWNCPPEDFHSIPRPLIQMALPDTDISALLANAQVGSQTSEQTGTDADGNPLTSGMTDVVKADLPKKVPLIEPMHRVFDVKDLGQLKGFTGEWVVSIHNDGQRCKVIKRGNRIRILDAEGERQSTSDTVREGLRAICKKDYVIDGTLKDGEFHVNDILHYDDDDITDLSTRERIKILRGQFDSYDPVFIPSPSDIRITDDVGLKDAVSELSKESDKILLRDAKSTYMRGEEKHPKWVLLAKSDVVFHVPFSMEIDDSRFILHLPEDVVKYEIVDERPVNPKAVMGGIADSDYSIRLAESLESYWEDGFKELLKEETEIEPEIDEERIEEESAGILKPKKDKNLIMKPRDMYKALLLIERALDKMEKGFSNLAGRGLGIDVGGGVESPRGPTKLDAEQSMPDWDMKKRPTQDSEKPEDYPGRKRKKKKTETQYNELAERSLEG